MNNHSIAESKSQIVARVKKERYLALVKDWREQTTPRPEDPEYLKDILLRMQPMYDYLLEPTNATN